MSSSKNFKIIDNQKVAPFYYLMNIKAPEIAVQGVPGQFVHIKVIDNNINDPLLRRPFSFFDIDKESGIIRLVYEVVARAAKLCYSSSDIEGILDNMTVEKRKSFVNKLEKIGHFSPFEHITFNFGIEGVSRVLTHQLVRHRIASYSQKSMRYVREKDDLDFIIPKKVKEDKKVRDKFVKHMDRSFNLYNEITENLMDNGYDEKESIEEARYVLPVSYETKIMASFNARSLFNFFKLKMYR